MDGCCRWWGLDQSEPQKGLLNEYVMSRMWRAFSMLANDWRLVLHGTRILQTWTLSLLIRRLAVTPLTTTFIHACAFHAKAKHNADSLPSSGPAGPFHALAWGWAAYSVFKCGVLPLWTCRLWFGSQSLWGLIVMLLLSWTEQHLPADNKSWGGSQRGREVERWEEGVGTMSPVLPRCGLHCTSELRGVSTSCPGLAASEK